MIAPVSRDTERRPMVSIFKRGNKLYLQFVVEGKKYQRSTGLDDTPANRRTVQKKIIPKLQAKIASGKFDTPKPKVEAFEWYARKYSISKEHLKTWRDLNATVNVYVNIFRGRRIDTIKAAEIEEILLDKAIKTTPRTAKMHLGVLKGIFKIAARYEHIEKNPCDVVELPRHEPKEVDPFTAEEVAAILEASDGWFRNYLAVSFFTGMRPGEVFALMHTDIDLQGRIINVSRAIKYGKIETPKTRSGIRLVPILSPLVPYLQEQMSAASKSLYLFPSEEGGPMYGASIVKKRWRAVLKKCGIEYRKPYATRHTFITTMLNSGQVSLMELAKIVGHKNSEMIVKNYAKYIRAERIKMDVNFDPFSANQLAK